MQKPPIIEQIEKIWGKDFILHPATAHPTLLSGVMAFKEGQPKYALDEQGRLIGLNLATTRLDNERWQEVVHLLEEHEVRLQALNLSDNQLTELKLPTNMRELFTLDFSSNKIIEFSPPAGMNNLSDINLFENPLKSPPPDVVKQGKSEILKWLKAANKRPVLEAKVMFIGDSNYGKTHLIEMLRHKKIRENTTIETTHGIERKRLTDAESAEGPIRLNVWDLGGQQYMRSTHQFFFTERTLYVLVTVARRERKDLNHWLKLVQRIGKDAPVLVVINKTDLDEGDIDREPLLREYSNIVGFVRTAINDCPARGVNALDTINELEKNIHRIISNKELMPSVFVRQRQEWFTVKNELEAMKEDYISYEDYQRRPHIRDLPKEEQDQTLRQLTSLGTVVSFLDVYRLKNTNVINPRWLLDGIYRLLNDHKIKKERQGLFRFADLARLLDQRRYPDQKYPFLVDLMQEFKLCYPLTCFKNTCEPAWLLPDLFTDIEPPDVWPHVNTMRFRLNYNSPPDLFITQFIVDRYASIVDEKRWRSGVVVTDGTCQAIIRRSFKYDHIEIEVAGPKNMRRGYLQFLLTVFGDLHKPFELEVQKELPFEGEWLNYNDLMVYEEYNQQWFHPKLKKPIPVSEVLDGYGRPGEGKAAYQGVIERLDQLDSKFDVHAKENRTDHARSERKLNKIRSELERFRTEFKRLSGRSLDQSSLEFHFEEVKALLTEMAQIPELKEIPKLADHLAKLNKEPSKTSVKVVASLLPKIIQDIQPWIPNIQVEYEITDQVRFKNIVEKLFIVGDKIFAGQNQ